MKKISLKKPQYMLALALIVCIVGSMLAGLFHTSFNNVTVKEITFKGDHGTLNGLLYMPKGAGENDPRPLIITTHGYLNSKEMQDAPAIEMSRRGYIVLALDMYDHGNSRWSGKIPNGQQFSTFWIYSQFDAAKYMYTQKYVKKDSKGNAYIAVSGHSMGGFSTLLAMYMDEMYSLKTGVRMIYSGVSVGADFSYAAAVAKQEQLQAAYGSRTVGMIAAHYDEFFFNKSATERNEAEKKITGTVTYKDFVSTLSGKSFLGVSPTGTAQAGKFYTVDSGAVSINGADVRPSQQGQRIIYTPNETHPWNTFSLDTTSNLIDFYAKAFVGVTSPNQTNANLPSSNQIWQFKELFSFIALIGFFMMFVPLIQLLLKVPGLKLAKTEMPNVLNGPKTTAQKSVFWILIVISALIPAYFYPALMDKTGEGMSILSHLSTAVLIVLAVVIITFWGTYIKKSKDKDSDADEAKEKAKKVSISVAIIAVLDLILMLCVNFASGVFATGSFFNQTVTNQFSYWALIISLIVAITTISTYYLSKKPDGSKLADYGISFNIPAILSGLAIAVITVVAGYVLLWITQAITTTDYRIWVFAVKTFTTEYLITFLKYMPVFLIFYFINTIVINANTRFAGLEGIKGYILAILMNIGGMMLWLIFQYGSAVATQVGAFTTQNLNSIVLLGLLPILALAAVFSKKIFKETGNVWLAAFLNAFLFTMIAVANTCLFWNTI